MNRTLHNQLSRMEALARNHLAGTCPTCNDGWTVHVLVPDPADVDLPINNPTACPECGGPIAGTRQLVGVSKVASDRILTASDGTVHSMYCPTCEEGGQ